MELKFTFSEFKDELEKGRQEYVSKHREEDARDLLKKMEEDDSALDQYLAKIDAAIDKTVQQALEQAEKDINEHGYVVRTNYSAPIIKRVMNMLLLVCYSSKPCPYCMFILCHPTVNN